jgi:uncharacterized protein (DUF2252 family)
MTAMPELPATDRAQSAAPAAEGLSPAPETTLLEAARVETLPTIVFPPAGPTTPITREPLPEVAASIAAGKALREAVPRESHGDWKPAGNRRDPIDILQDQDKTRVPFLVPIRYGRMLQSPFAFLRGSSAVMAGDLARTPVSGIKVQACGDCHLVNFGGFATPERNIIFDINDFDETLRAPWEWDVKRLAASFVVAGRNNGLAEADSRAAAREAVRTYRIQMAEFAQMHVLDVWYAKLDLDTILAGMKDVEWAKKIRAGVEKLKARSVPEHEFPKMAEEKDGRPIIKDSPPLIFHTPGILDEGLVLRALQRYRDALPADRRFLFDRYRYCDIAIKVVGVGSVGTLCAVVLLMASPNDPLFLQVKEANASVLEPYAGKGRHDNHGERVVTGQRMMQSASDIFLGWTIGDGGRHFYVRQLRDLKIKPIVESYNASRLLGFARATGWTLARAHARSGDAAMISGYLGKNDIFDQAVERFAVAYADQTESDHAALANAVRSGRIEVITE